MNSYKFISLTHGVVVWNRNLTGERAPRSGAAHLQVVDDNPIDDECSEYERAKDSSIKWIRKGGNIEQEFVVKERSSCV
ncbi:MAG: hypothetical protein AMXMBFR74_28160 [Parvibaculum sp.]